MELTKEKWRVVDKGYGNIYIYTGPVAIAQMMDPLKLGDSKQKARTNLIAAAPKNENNNEMNY